MKYTPSQVMAMNEIEVLRSFDNLEIEGYTLHRTRKLIPPAWYWPAADLERTKDLDSFPWDCGMPIGALSKVFVSDVAPDERIVVTKMLDTYPNFPHRPPAMYKKLPTVMEQTDPTPD